MLLSAKPFSDIHTVDSALGLEMIWVETKAAGEPVTYIRGSPLEEVGRLSNEEEHNVTLINSYYLGKHEVTQAQYEAVMRGNSRGINPRPSKSGQNPEQPVENLSWSEISDFLEILNFTERKAERLPPDWSYSLPTEAQWEYACRAGTTTAYSFGDELDGNQSNFRLSATSKPKAVGQYPANPFGFFDMHGNVAEWCQDYYSLYPAGSLVDPTGPKLGNSRIARGGSFDQNTNQLRSARRAHHPEEFHSINLGFRLALIQRDSNYSFEYSLNGIEISHLESPHFQIDATWGEHHQAEPVYYLSDANLSILPGVDPSLSGGYFLFEPTFQANANSFDRKVNGQSEPVREFGYTLVQVEQNPTGAWEKNTTSTNHSFVRTNDAKTFLDGLDLQPIARFGPQDQEGNFSTHLDPYAYSVIFEKAFSGEFALFLDQGGPIGSGWMWAKWFGYYYADEFPWIYHENLGWSYIEQNSSDELWMHREHLGWAWTNPDTFPHLWRSGYDENDTRTWLFLKRNARGTFYDFNQSEWFNLNQPYSVSASITPKTGGSISGTGNYYRWQRASLEALPAENYKFLSWAGDHNSTETKLELEIRSDLSLRASFVAESPASLSTEDRMQQFEEILSIRDDLTPLQKEKAILEYLFYGNSPTAGIP